MLSVRSLLAHLYDALRQICNRKNQYCADCARTKQSAAQPFRVISFLFLFIKNPVPDECHFRDRVRDNRDIEDKDEPEGLSGPDQAAPQNRCRGFQDRYSRFPYPDIHFFLFSFDILCMFRQNPFPRPFRLYKCRVHYTPKQSNYEHYEKKTETQNKEPPGGSLRKVPVRKTGTL